MNQVLTDAGWEQVTGNDRIPVEHWEWRDPKNGARYRTADAIDLQQWRNGRRQELCDMKLD